MFPTLDGPFGDRADVVTVAGRSISWERLRSAATAVAGRISGAPRGRGGRDRVAVGATASRWTRPRGAGRDRGALPRNAMGKVRKQLLS